PENQIDIWIECNQLHPESEVEQCKKTVDHLPETDRRDRDGLRVQRFRLFLNNLHAGGWNYAVKISANASSTGVISVQDPAIKIEFYYTVQQLLISLKCTHSHNCFPQCCRNTKNVSTVIIERKDPIYF